MESLAAQEEVLRQLIVELKRDKRPGALTANAPGLSIFGNDSLMLSRAAPRWNRSRREVFRAGRAFGVGQHGPRGVGHGMLKVGGRGFLEEIDNLPTLSIPSRLASGQSFFFFFMRFPARACISSSSPKFMQPVGQEATQAGTMPCVIRSKHMSHLAIRPLFSSLRGMS